MYNLLLMYSDFSHLLPEQMGGHMLGTEGDLSEYIYVYTPWSDIALAPSCVWPTDFLLSVSLNF